MQALSRSHATSPSRRAASPAPLPSLSGEHPRRPASIPRTPMRLVLSQRARTVCMRRSDMLGMPTGGFDMAGLQSAPSTSRNVGCLCLCLTWRESHQAEARPRPTAAMLCVTSLFLLLVPRRRRPPLLIDSILPREIRPAPTFPPAPRTSPSPSSRCTTLLQAYADASDDRIAIAANPARASTTRTRPCIRDVLGLPTASATTRLLPRRERPWLQRCASFLRSSRAPGFSSCGRSPLPSSPAGGGAVTRSGRYSVYRSGWTVLHLPSAPVV